VQGCQRGVDRLASAGALGTYTFRPPCSRLIRFMPAGARCRQSDKCFFSPFCFFGRYFQLFCSPQNDLTQRGRAGPSRQRANRKERERAPVRLDTAAQLDVRCGAADFLAVRRGVGLQKRARHAVKQFTHFWPQVSGLVEYVGPSRRAVKQFTHFWPQVSGLVKNVGPSRRAVKQFTHFWPQVSGLV
jgi:hypothetical protein